MASYRYGLAATLVMLMLECILVTSMSRTVLEEVRRNGKLRKFSSLLDKYNLTDLLERPSVTVFVPVTAAYAQFEQDAGWFGYKITEPTVMENVLLYHIGDGITRVSEMRNHSFMQTFHPHNRYLYFNHYNYGDTQVYTVNGAHITTSDIIASNGVVHIIDRFISPVQSSKTVADFLTSPDLPDLAFVSISLASIIDMKLKNATNSTSNIFTVFAPNDSYIMPMPDYGKNELFMNNILLKTVFWAHVVERDIVYIPKIGDIPDMTAKAGVIRFYRVGSEVYVSNNKVRARVVQANIPVLNGVVHVIDDLLFYVYRTIPQKITVLPNARFINNSLTKVDKYLLEDFHNTSRKFTFFLPTDDAFAKLPTDKQLQLEVNSSRLTQMIKDHVIMYGERDVQSFQDGETFTTTDGKILTIHKINGDIYVEGGAIKAKITAPDIGCINGVMHLISSVLFQRDFTIWDAIQGNHQLSAMRRVVNQSPELRETLNSIARGPMTVFLISDAAWNSLPSETQFKLKRDIQPLVQAIKGSIAHSYILSSTQISDDQDVQTMSGHTITLYNTNQGLYIVGSLIRANVVVEDIWCSNGILHITDNILHLPTRTITDEIGVHPSLNVMSNMLRALKDLSIKLADTSRQFTMFVPSDEAFTYLPTQRADKIRLKPSLLEQIVSSHVVSGASTYVEEYDNYTAYKSEEGGTIFVIRSTEKVYAVNNNVRGNVIESNIRCTNGMIHVVDTLLHFPYKTVEQTLNETPRLRRFYELVRRENELNTWTSMYDVNQTLFVPSNEFMSTLSNFHLTYLENEQGKSREIFEGHFLPGNSLTQPYLDKAFKDSRVFLEESRYDVTFTLMDLARSSSAELSSVDVGFSNLRQMFDRAKDGIACSNGIIYVINGFLNFPLNDIPNEIKVQPEISIGTDQLVKLIPSNSSIHLDSKNTVFTMLAPADGAFDHLTLDDINFINQNLSYTQRIEIVQRHIIKGQKMDYDAIVNGKYSRYAQDRNMSLISRTDGLYIRWLDIEAKIIRHNILATNGIIHVVDRLFLATPHQTTTPTPTTQKTTKSFVSSSHELMTSRLRHAAFLIVSSLMCFIHYLMFNKLNS